MPGTAAATGPSDAESSQLNTSDLRNARNLADAMNLLSRFGDEYMDENPLVGEPGAFIFSKNPASGPGGDQERPASTLTVPSRKPGASGMGTPAPSVAPATPSFKSDAGTVATGKKGERGGERTPATPGTPGGTSAGKEKIRKRKSKSGLAGS